LLQNPDYAQNAPAGFEENATGILCGVDHNGTEQPESRSKEGASWGIPSHLYTVKGMALQVAAVALFRVSSRRLEDRMRELCAKVVLAQGEELETTLAALQEALAEHAKRFRKLATEGLLNDLSRPERRAS
jgi:hypothetical protein